MKKIQDLKPNEAVEINTIKEAKKLCKLLNEEGMTRIGGQKFRIDWLYDPTHRFLVREEENTFDAYPNSEYITAIYPASCFFTKKKSWESEIERLDSEINELRNMLSKDKSVSKATEQPKDIDWSVPGRLVVANDGEGSAVFLVTGSDSDSNTFEGVCILEDRLSKKGEYYKKWDCKDFKAYTGEPIIVKP